MSDSKKFPVSDEDFQMSTHTGRNLTAWRCVQVAIKEEGVAVRDSKDPGKTTLFFNPQEWAAFVKGVKENQFDPLGGVEANLL